MFFPVAQPLTQARISLINNMQNIFIKIPAVLGGWLTFTFKVICNF